MSTAKQTPNEANGLRKERLMASTSYFRVTVFTQTQGTEVTDLPAEPCFTADDIERIADERAAHVAAELGEFAYSRYERMVA